jgi:two-component system response regulator VicR
MKRRILVVEDDRAFSQVLCHFLFGEGFDVQSVQSGNDAFAVADRFVPHLTLLDLTLPGRSGFELCAIWQRTKRFPIIIITSRVQKTDELRGFELGADDYITKPFDLDKLLARMNAVLRRTRSGVSRITLGDIEIDFDALTAKRGDRSLDLSHREFELLHYLSERQNQLVPREELLRDIWGYSDDLETRSVDMAINRLRRKLGDDPHHPKVIHTARGGYVLTCIESTGAETDSPR